MEGINWGDVGSTVESFATAGGIIVGGLFAYYKFFKDRTYRPRLALGVSGERVRARDGSCSLICTAKVDNKGSTKIRLEEEGTALHVARMSVPSEQYEPAGVADNEPQQVFLGILRQHKWIEGTEQIEDKRVVALPDCGEHLLELTLRLVIRDPSPFRCRRIEISAVDVLRLPPTLDPGEDVRKGAHQANATRPSNLEEVSDEQARQQQAKQASAGHAAAEGGRQGGDEAD